MVLLTTRFFDVAKFIILANSINTALQKKTLIRSCRFENILFPKFYIKISEQNFHMVFKKMIDNLLNSSLNRHFSPHLVHVHSKQRYYTGDLSELYITLYHQPTLLSYLLILVCCVQKNPVSNC